MLRKKYQIVTLGCRTNQYESAAYQKQLEEMGYEEGTPADLCIVNTCTVTDSADSSSRHKIRAILREHPNAQIWVTGCMVGSKPEELKKIDPRIELVPNLEKEQLIQKIFPSLEEYPEFKIDAFEGKTRAFVKVQDGCNSYCTYCIIPYVRGRSRSRPVKEILEEIQGLIASGYKEIVLTGINIGDFEADGLRLAGLVRAVDALPGLKRLRLSSIDPDEVDEELTNAILEGKNTVPSLHIVLQSGSNAILKRMNRKYTKEIFLETIAKLRKARPLFGFTTDVIVGFPGETDADFEETLSILEEVGFMKVHMFPYSPRARTRAALYPNRVEPEVMNQRREIVLRKSEEEAFRAREKFVGQKLSLLIEQEENGYWSGYSENFARVFIPKNNFRPNDEVVVEIVENRPEGLYGKI